MDNICLPTFPVFDALQLDYRESIETVTSRFSPYSDYHFFSLVTYDVLEKVMVSQLNGNLIVKFQEYTTEDFYLSFIGNLHPVETVDELMKYTREHGLPNMLRLVPSESFSDEQLRVLRDNYTVTEDEDNFDYIISVEDLVNMKGKKLHQKKKSLNKFFHQYVPEVKFFSLQDKEAQEWVNNGLEIWKQNHPLRADSSKNEYLAIKKSSTLASHFNAQVLVVTIGGRLAGFTIFELVSDDYAICSFQKGDVEYFGIYEYMYHVIGKYIQANGGKYVNIEQDLGLPGLRMAKRKYNPKYLKKYTIKPI